MIRHSAILFPDTVPNEPALFPLVQVFQPVVYCQPVENDPAVMEKKSLMLDEFLSHSLCRRVFPAPLGPDRDRFLRLISDLHHRGDDYAAQLASVSLASIGTAGAADAESKGAILTSLLKRHGIGRTGSDKKSMILWQSRLILKLGELYDDSQLALRTEMERIREREKDLIAELRRESEHSYSLTEKLYSGSVEDEDQRLLRLKAWARIFALGKDSPEGCRIFVSLDQDAFDRLAEEYELLKGENPKKTMSLRLPASPVGEDMTALEQVRKFSEGVHEYLEQIGRMVQGRGPVPEPAGENGAWGQFLEQSYPAAACGRRELALYRFEQISAPRFFLDAFGNDDDIRLLEEGSLEDLADIFIGVLSRSAG